METVTGDIPMSPVTVRRFVCIKASSRSVARPKCFARVFAAHVDPSDPPHRGAATAANNLSEPSGAIFVRDAPERGGLPLEFEMLDPIETAEGFAHGNATATRP